MTSATLGALRLVLAAATFTTAACGKKAAVPPAEQPAAAQPAPPPPVAVASIDLGNSVGADGRIGMAAVSFSAKDTIYASVGTTGVGSGASLGAKWSFVKADGSLIPVNETSQTISPAGPVATEFHISNQKPWPKGKYRVEVQLNGASAGVKDFQIQ